MINLQTPEQRKEKQLRAIELLEPQGFVHMGFMMFFYEGKIYDLEGVDLDQIEQALADPERVLAE